MSTQPILKKLNLSEFVKDGNELIYEMIEVNNCLQLRRCLKCHGRPVGANTTDSVERLECLFLFITKKKFFKISIDTEMK